MRPCFFHPAVGNIRRQAFTDITNGPEALRFRSGLDVASNAICQRCRLFTVSGATETEPSKR